MIEALTGAAGVHDAIVVRGAREHNLKNIDVEIPRNKLVVITGISGSGKSSLAFDTIYAEGQRRYVESLSAYARQFLGQMEKPDVDYIEGLSPAISIDQKGVSHNPRSTVGTVTEIYDYLRLLFARIGHPHCPQCGRPIQRQTVEQIVDALLALPTGTRLMLLAPRVRDRKGEHRQVFEEARRAGFVRVRVNGQVRDLGEEIVLNKNLKHTVEIVVDRLVIRPAEDGVHPDRGRIADSVETALKLGEGTLIASLLDVPGGDGTGQELLFSEHFACPSCNLSFGELEPRSFSFNSPHGACPTCTGLGTTLVVDPDLVVGDPDLSLAQGVILPWSRGGPGTSYYATLLGALAQQYGFSTRAPWRELAPEHRHLVLYGRLPEASGNAARATGRRGAGGDHVLLRVRYSDRGAAREITTTYEGVIPNLERRYHQTDSEFIRSEIERYMAARPCPACNGARLKPASLAVRVAGRTIAEVTAMAVGAARRWFDGLDAALSERERTIARQVLKEIRARLAFLSDVGLDYLTLDRAASTLSGGEAQRIRLATQIGSQLVGVLYILDEPSIGLHQRDNRRLIATLERLRDLGNTVLVVEHDEETIRSADWVIDIGPGAGEHGGRIVASGPLDRILACPDSLTGQYLSGARAIAIPERRQRRRATAPSSKCAARGPTI
ncbi:MAG: hypothetical protein KatS3mg057_3197 [Herpetosiphonaceae bacterium]|nr:MAG: hypothetical protein KatS3mg057_3197 [Herpetosiphonaceae bacterium]